MSKPHMCASLEDIRVQQSTHNQIGEEQYCRVPNLYSVYLTVAIFHFLLPAKAIRKVQLTLLLFVETHIPVETCYHPSANSQKYEK